MEDQNISHQDSMRIIQSMINTAKNRVTERGFHFLLWGILVIITSIVEYFLIKNGNDLKANLAWIIMPFIGTPIAIIYEFRRNKLPKTKGYIDTWYKFLWFAFCITLLIIVVISVFLQVSPIPFILAIVGLATFVSGCIYNFNPLKIGGLIFWIASIIAMFNNMPVQMLINAVATFLGYIVPGIILWQNAKKTGDV